MADVKWIKLATNIFDNRKIRMIESMPDGDAVIVIWLKLLCLAGNINDSGMVYFTSEIPYTDQMLATQFGAQLSTVQLALRTFEHFGMVEVVDDILHISNWEKYQNIEGMDRIREQNRIRKQRQREKQRTLDIESECHATVTQCHATDKEEDKNKSKNKNKYSVDFDVFWEAYPKKIGKEAAWKAYRKVSVGNDVLLKAISSQRLSKKWQKDDGQFIPNPATWLNQGRWLDEVEHREYPVRQSTATADYLAEIGTKL